MDLTDVLAAVEAGEFDGHLDDIVKAMIERVRSGAVDMRWRIRFDGDEWTEDSVTLGELGFAEKHATVIDPDGRRRPATRIEIDPRVTAEHALALVVAHLHKAQGVPLRDAVKRAEQITAADLETMVDEYEVVRAPKDGSPESTSS